MIDTEDKWNCAEKVKRDSLDPADEIMRELTPRLRNKELTTPRMDGRSYVEEQKCKQILVEDFNFEHYSNLKIGDLDYIWTREYDKPFHITGCAVYKPTGEFCKRDFHHWVKW